MLLSSMIFLPAVMCLSSGGSLLAAAWLHGAARDGASPALAELHLQALSMHRSSSGGMRLPPQDSESSDDEEGADGHDDAPGAAGAGAGPGAAAAPAAAAAAVEPTSSALVEVDEADAQLKFVEG
eukprot:COSAG04_NODE_14552_length_563_cov_1.148707_1_plen_124_part_10